MKEKKKISRIGSRDCRAAIPRSVRMEMKVINPRHYWEKYGPTKI